MTDYPCRYCQKRHPGCHGGCEAYQAVKQARDSAREAEQAGRPSTAPIYTQAQKARQKRARNKGGAI
jgi:hypothetical protein